jgi:hypothetical protein
MGDRYNAACAYVIGMADPAHWYAQAARFLLSVASIVLIALPFTQHIWTWDRFLHGGQDFETTVLLIVISLCLAMVLVQSCRQTVKLLITSLSLLFLRLRQPAVQLRDGVSGSSCNGPHPPPTDTFNRPLLI